MYPGQFYLRGYTGFGLEDPSRKRYNGTIDVKAWSHSRFFNQEGLMGMKFLNDIEPPTVGEIKQFQKENIKKFFPANRSVQEKLQSLFIEQSKEALEIKAEADIGTEEMVEIIEAVTQSKFYNWEKGHFQNNSKIINKLSHRIGKNDSIEEYEKILEQLQNVYELLKNTTLNNTNSTIPMINEKEIAPQAEKIKKAIKKLEADISDAKNQKFHRGTYFKIEKNTSFAKMLSGIGNELKGRKVEIEAENFIDEKIVIPISNEMGQNLKLIDLANFKIMGGGVNIFGQSRANNSVKSRTDFQVVNMDLAKLIDFPYYKNGKKNSNGTLADFIKDLEESNGSSTDISIQADSDIWQNILNNSAFIFGGQVKSGYGQSPFNSFNVSTREAFEAGGLTSLMMPHILNVFLQWYGFGHIVANAPQFDLFFNWGISHWLTYIIGKGNNYLILRNKIISTIDYFEAQINAGKFIKGLKPATLANPDAGIPVNLSGRKDFEYPSLSRE